MRRKRQGKRGTGSDASGAEMVPPTLAPDFVYSPSQDCVGVAASVASMPTSLSAVSRLPSLTHIDGGGNADLVDVDAAKLRRAQRLVCVRACVCVLCVCITILHF